MSGREKGGKGLGKRGVKRISGLIYEETRGVLKIFLPSSSCVLQSRHNHLASSIFSSSLQSSDFVILVLHHFRFSDIHHHFRKFVTDLSYLVLINKRALRNKSLSISFNEKDLRFPFKFSFPIEFFFLFHWFYELCKGILFRLNSEA